MKPRFLFSLTPLLTLTLLFPSQSAHAAAPSVKTAVRHDVSAALRDMASVKLNTQGSSQEMPEPRPTRAPFSSGTSDPVAKQLSGTLQDVTTGLNFEGQAAQDTFNVFGYAFVPPDTNGAPGLNQYVQIVNVTIAVYNKSTGTQEMSPVAIHTLWTGFGGPCEFQLPDGGDPVVLYDHLAHRWLRTPPRF